jgi:hypothetical protein
MTFKYFYPRNDIMFFNPITDWEQVRTAWSEWSNMNWIRTGVLAIGIACSAISIHLTYVELPMRKKQRQSVKEFATV